MHVRREFQILRDAANGESCVRCGACDGTVVLAHYTGVRRLAYGGGLGIKVHDAMGAHLCAACHAHMDQLSRDKSKRWEHSEEFLHYIALTVIRLIERGIFKIQKGS
jgi:Protein of unknown function (DUF1364)